tara:strand:+ start:251 stop:487 length:237 start_codon:yes stop_codon:yes gene_type:complete
MYVRRLLYSNFGRIVISILLGLGLATIFRKVCKDRKCLVFKAPKLDKVKGQVFKFDGKCYKYREEATKCDPNKRIVDF